MCVRVRVQLREARRVLSSHAKQYELGKVTSAAFARLGHHARALTILLETPEVRTRSAAHRRLALARAHGVPRQLPRRGDARRGALRADPLRRCAAARRCRPPAAARYSQSEHGSIPHRKALGRSPAVADGGCEKARRWPMEAVKGPAMVRTAWRLRQAHMALRCVAPSALSWCALSAAGKMRHVHIGTQLLSLFGHAADACAHLQARRQRGSLFRRTTSRARSRRVCAGGRNAS